MSPVCLANVPRHELVDCDHCTETYFTYQVKVIDDRGWFCTVTRKYRWRICFLGIGIGKHVYSLTLLPKEELELEIVRRAKFTTALHEQESIEQEVEITLQEELKTEWSLKTDISSAFLGSVEAKFLGITAKTVIEFEAAVHTLQGALRTVVAKTASRVTAKYETSIDVKTEVENQYRAVRKVSNPNPCQPVTYHYYQIMKKFRRELFLVESLYECSPPAGNQPRPVPGVAVYTVGSPRPQNLRPDIVAAPPQWTISDTAGTVPSSVESARSVSEPRANVTEVEVPVPPPTAKEYTKARAIDEIRGRVDEETLRSIACTLDRIDDVAQPPGDGGLIDTFEYCVGTDGFYVEANVSECAACEDTELQMKELEVKKEELELEKLKCEIELCKQGITPKPNKRGG